VISLLRLGQVPAVPGHELDHEVAEANAQLMSRTARVMALGESAAPIDPQLAQLRERGHKAMRSDFRAVAEALAAHGALADDIDVGSASATIYALVNESVYLRLVDGLGWTPDQYRDWLARLSGRCSPQRHPARPRRSQRGGFRSRSSSACRTHPRRGQAWSRPSSCLRTRETWAASAPERIRCVMHTLALERAVDAAWTSTRVPANLVLPCKRRRQRQPATRRLAPRSQANVLSLGPGVWLLLAPPLSPCLTTNDGAFMEPRGCNRWQSVANRIGSEAAKTSEIRCRGLRPVDEWSAW
jgi:hypothetical protein